MIHVPIPSTVPASTPAIKVVEVGPRDGLQNEVVEISLADKERLINDLIEAGLSAIEIGSFVSPRWVRQMANSEALAQSIRRRPGLNRIALVPNLRGLEAAYDAGLDSIAIFAAATEAFSHANLNASCEASMDRFAAVAEEALARGLRVRGYLSCAVHCPYEGWVSPAHVAGVADKLFRLGCYEVSLCDTTGAATPSRAKAMIASTRTAIPVNAIAVHFHDTYGQALANTLACLDLGVTTVDSSVAGLGGCPYSPGASGNLATEDLIYMLHGMGLGTGIDLSLLVEAGRSISKVLGKAPASRASAAISANKTVPQKICTIAE